MPSTALKSLYGGKKALAGNVGGQQREQTVLTPKWLLNELRRWASGNYDGTCPIPDEAMAPIALDPCTTPQNPNGAKVWLTNLLYQQTNPPKGPVDNGLELNWFDIWTDNFGFTYVNPPYADLQVWLRKCVNEARSGTPIYALVPWRSNREWFCGTLSHGGATATTLAPIPFVGSKSAFPAPLCILTWNLPIPDSITMPVARGLTREIVTGVFRNTRQWDY